jgi:hypothetical protein
VTLSYTIGAQKATLNDSTYPFEFTVPVPAGATAFDFEVQAVTLSGEKQSAGPATLQR